MTPPVLLSWLVAGTVAGTLFFAFSVLLARTVFARARPSLRAALFTLTLLRFVFPFGPNLARSPAEPEGGVVFHMPRLEQELTAALAPTWETLFLWVWGAVVLVLGARRLAGALRMQRHLAASPRASPHILERVRTVAAGLGVAMPRVVHHGLGPAVVGWWRPVVLLPVDVGERVLDAMLVHELTHLRRRDPLVRALQALVETLFFFWPPVWLVGPQLALAREQACDLAVIESRVLDRSAYATLLLELGLADRGRLAMAAPVSQLSRRLELVLSETRASRRPLLFVALVLAGLTATARSWPSAIESVAAPAPQPTDWWNPHVAVTGALDVSVGVLGDVRASQLDQPALRGVLALHQSELSECFASFRRAEPAARGTLELRWAIGTDGRSTGPCGALGTQGTDPRGALAACVCRHLATWDFPRPAGRATQGVSVECELEGPPQ